MKIKDHAGVSRMSITCDSFSVPWSIETKTSHPTDTQTKPIRFSFPLVRTQQLQVESRMRKTPKTNVHLLLCYRHFFVMLRCVSHLSFKDTCEVFIKTISSTTKTTTAMKFPENNTLEEIVEVKSSLHSVLLEQMCFIRNSRLCDFSFRRTCQLRVKQTLQLKSEHATARLQERTQRIVGNIHEGYVTLPHSSVAFLKGPEKCSQPQSLWEYFWNDYTDNCLPILPMMLHERDRSWQADCDPLQIKPLKKNKRRTNCTT